MAGLNKVMILGNVGRDPEMRYTPGGAAVANFPVAVSRNWTTPDGEKRDETEWFNVVVWNKLAETAGNLISKGRKVYIEGRLHTNSWEKEGEKRYRTEVIAQAFLLLDRNPNAQPREDMPDDESGEAF